MQNLHTYLIASLPMLHLGMKPPFSFGRFLEICQELIPEEDVKVLNTLPQAEEYSEKNPMRPVIQKWTEFDMALRNELVKIRAGRRHLDTAKYLRVDGYNGSSLTHIALAAQRNPSVLEAEKTLDEARWQALEELAFGHYFDLDFLIIYSYKLLILQRWEKVNSADKPALLEQALAH